ncbi:hypothetical protein [Arundinibacter roseus]|uniref:Uncharacterized protein n=1 Tax=Arundinibacter roseus TaxID=2070510 RepID=A0A4R4JV37_9BACT|nr:hypothetical protein [Arundinibacter roseus]TDB58548.1 hypothetical protein EZE20_23080 [Arundinibacter roseus]
MIHFKKELFFLEHKAPISCQPISDNEMLYLNGLLVQRYGINKSINGNFFKVLQDKLSYKKDYEGINSSSEIETVLQDLALLNDSEAFLIWNYPDEIDKFDLSYLIRYWEDIWFSISDEVVGVFFPVMDRIIIITHYNVVYY